MKFYLQENWTFTILEDVNLVVNTASPEDIAYIGGNSYIHNALQLREAVTRVEAARMPILPM